MNINTGGVQNENKIYKCVCACAFSRADACVFHWSTLLYSC